MAKYSAIKAAVNAYIKQNGRKEITGKILNAVLNATIDSLGKFYQFAGEALPTDDPGTPDQNLTYLAGTAGTYTNFGGLTLDTQEIALLMWDGEWKKQTLLFGIQEVDASVDNQVGTPSVDVDFVNNVLTLSFHNIKGDKGDTGDPAGFGQVTASVDDTIGNPSVQVQTSGEDTAKNIAFEFHGLRGETGITSVVVSVDNTTGNPACSVSLVGQVLHLDFTGLKGLKGDTGVSADYPITIYNGLDSDATDQALSAAQGKVLDGKVSQLGQEVDELDTKVSGGNLYTQIATDSFLSSTTVGTTQFNVINGQTYKVHCQSSESLNQNNLAVYFKSATDETRLSGTYNSGNSVDFAEGVDFDLVATATGTAVLRISTSGVTSHKTLSFVIYKVDETEGLIQKVGELESFDENIPLPAIQSITKNVVPIKGHLIDNKYYDTTSGNIASYNTYCCTEKISIDCDYLLVDKIVPSGVLFWDANDTYLGSVSASAIVNGRIDVMQNATKVALNLIKASQPSGYAENGIIYNVEPFVPFDSITTRLSSLEAFEDNVPLSAINKLTARIYCIKDYFIDNCYYSNATGQLFMNVPTYACTSKIAVDKGYYYIYGFAQSTCLCWAADSSFLGICQYNNSQDKKFTLLDNTAFIAFNFAKASQPDGYINNGFVFNMQPFVKDYDSIIVQQNILYGKKWCVCGDSFSAWSTEQDGSTYKTYHYFIGQKNNMTIVNMAASGRTMAYPSDHTFDNALAKPSVYQSIPADADYITIMLGINDTSHLAGYSPDGESTAGAISLGTIDSTDTGTFYGAWNVVMQWLFENRPLAHIGIILTNGLGQQGPSGGYSEYGMQIYTALKDIVSKWNVPFIDLNGGDGKTPMMQRGIYPEGTSSALIAAKWNAFAASPTTPYNGHTNVAGHLYESTFIENFLRTL